MTKYSAVRSATVFVIFLILLELAGSLAPGIITWGFHSLAYLHVSAIVIYGVAAILLIVAMISRPPVALLHRTAEAFERTPAAFLAGTIALFTVAAYFLRVRVPLLGDSFILIKLYQNSFTGGHPFPPSHQPLSLFFYYAWIRLFGSFEFPQILDSFLYSELFLGWILIVVSYYIVKNLFDDRETRLSAFVLTLSLPAMQLFFGYVELYSILVVGISVYCLAALLYLRTQTSFYYVPAAMCFLGLIHYLNALLIPSFLYLTYVEFKRAGMKRLGISAIVIAIVAGLGIVYMGDVVQKLYPPHRATPLLSIGTTDDPFQAYTLFSARHLIDIVNLLLLLCPAGLFLVCLTLAKRADALIASPPAVFFLCAILPVAGFFTVAKFDLPLAQDWDVPASYCAMFALGGMVVASSWLGTNAPLVFALLASVTLLNAVPYWFLNSTVQPNIVRVESFMDPRVSSHDGCYQSSLHMTEYFIHAKDTAGIVRVSEKFLRLFPTDQRGYSNYTLYLQQFGASRDAKIEALFKSWLLHDPESAEAKEQFANFHLDAGNRSYNDGQLEIAQYHLHEAIRINPSLADAYNSLGIVYRKIGKTDSAGFMYMTTVNLDPKSVYAYINLGNLYDDAGNQQKAIEWYGKAFVLRPGDPTLLYNIGISYYKQRSFPEALVAMRRAAKAGERDAQAFLTQLGERW